jgi:hypothetical protein
MIWIREIFKSNKEMKMKSAQIVFNSKKAAIAYYIEAVRLGRTVSLPFKRRDNGRFQITELYKCPVL